MNNDWTKPDCPRNWPEDEKYDNGQYLNRCFICDQYFIGHKRRVECKECASKPVTDSTEDGGTPKDGQTI